MQHKRLREEEQVQPCETVILQGLNYETSEQTVTRIHVDP